MLRNGTVVLDMSLLDKVSSAKKKVVKKIGDAPVESAILGKSAYSYSPMNESLGNAIRRRPAMKKVFGAKNVSGQDIRDKLAPKLAKINAQKSMSDTPQATADKPGTAKGTPKTDVEDQPMSSSNYRATKAM